MMVLIIYGLTTKEISVKGLLLLLPLLVFIAPVYAAMGQATGTTTVFTDDTGFTVDLPQGWIANDFDNNGAEAQALEDNLGYTKLVTFYRGEDSFPSLGSEVSRCEISTTSDWVQVFRYKNLASKPEFASIVQSGRAITASDVFLYHLEELKRYADATGVRFEPDI
jgi:hypothetical protein